MPDDWQLSTHLRSLHSCRCGFFFSTEKDNRSFFERKRERASRWFRVNHQQSATTDRSLMGVKILRKGNFVFLPF